MFLYESTSATSVFTGPISGQGGVEVGDTTGLLELGSSLNSYSGGTDIQGLLLSQYAITPIHGTLQLTKDATTGAPATLGAGRLEMGQTGELDLNGCALTLTSLSDDGYVNDTTSKGALITDTSTGAGSTEPTVTRLTLDIPTGQSCTFSGNIADTTGSAANPDPTIRIMKTDAGTFVPNYRAFTGGGFEIDDGTVTIGTYFESTADNTIALTMNGGTLDLNGVERSDAGRSLPRLYLSQLDGAAGTITDDSASTIGLPSLITLAFSGTGHPSIFGGTIKDGTLDGGPGQLVALQLDGIFAGSVGALVLTGDSTYTGGTFIGEGCLQVGDGSTWGASITGLVDVAVADGLVFDVARAPTGAAPQVFDGQIETCQLSYDDTISVGVGVGSILKTGPGTLDWTATQSPNHPCIGAITVEEGTLELDNADALAQGSPLIIDEGATLNLAGNPTADLSTVTLNDGSIISTNSSGAVVAATLTASDSFNFAKGTIGAGVTLYGTASLNKRTHGTVTIFHTDALNNSGGTYVDQGTLTYSNGTAVSPSPGLHYLYWDPSATGATWDTASENWRDSDTNGSADAYWTNSANYVAVFDPSVGNWASNNWNSVTV
jgi:fibronectin-binding autotransporter adhesin